MNSSATWGDNGAGYYTSQKHHRRHAVRADYTAGFMHSMDDLSQYQTGEDALRTSAPSCRKL